MSNKPTSGGGRVHVQKTYQPKVVTNTSQPKPAPATSQQKPPPPPSKDS